MSNGQSQGRSARTAPPTTMGRVDRVWLPIEDRSVVHFFNRYLYFPHRLRERLTASARRMASLDRTMLPTPPDLTVLVDRAGVRPSASTVTAEGDHGEVLGEESDSRRLERVREIVIGFAGHPVLSGSEEPFSPGDHGERWILIKDGSRAERVIVLLFAPDRDRPSQVLKIVPEGVESLTRERDALVSLRSTLPEDLAASLPQPGILQRLEGWQVLPLSMVEGRPAYVEMQASWQPRRAAARHLQCAVQWLVRFQRETGSERAFLVRPDEQESLMRWAERLEEAGIEQPSEFESLLARCRQSPIHLCAGHGDFWARNLLVPDERRQPGRPRLPGIIDWESYRAQQEPFVDLFHFAVTYGLNYPWVRYSRIDPLKALHQTFIDDNHLSREIRRYFVCYCEGMGVDPDALRSLFRLYLLGLSTEGAPDNFAWSVRSHRDPNTWLDFFDSFRRAKRTVFVA